MITMYFVYDQNRRQLLITRILEKAQAVQAEGPNRIIVQYNGTIKTKPVPVSDPIVTPDPTPMQLREKRNTMLSRKVTNALTGKSKSN